MTIKQDTSLPQAQAVSRHRKEIVMLCLWLLPPILILSFLPPLPHSLTHALPPSITHPTLPPSITHLTFPSLPPSLPSITYTPPSLTHSHLSVISLSPPLPSPPLPFPSSPPLPFLPSPPLPPFCCTLHTRQRSEMLPSLLGPVCVSVGGCTG